MLEVGPERNLEVKIQREEQNPWEGSIENKGLCQTQPFEVPEVTATVSPQRQ